jgi:DNA modification methylase
MDKFIVPGLSVFDTRKNIWTVRNRQWKKLGIQSELGRDITKNSGNYRTGYGIYYGEVSTFNPTLCEIMYAWFCPEHGTILDPFAGGSVRGFVAEKCGYSYTGIELREEQVLENRKQCGATYHIGNSDIILDTIGNTFDFIFTCPPYFNLEVYSDEEGELSNLDTYEEFLEKYTSILSKSISKLKDNRFAVIVVSNIRDNKGYYRNFVGDTITAFEKNGMRLYNDMILLNSVGTVGQRTLRHFVNKRKVGKIHQNVLVFYKGNISKIEPLKEIKKYSFGDVIDRWSDET